MVGPSADPTKLNLKLLCSYGGKILPRYPDGKLRYLGGETRVLAVNRNISFSELLLKLGELCGTTVGLRCQLPTEDLDALISVKSDEDLVNLIEEYDRAEAAAKPLKIRAFLSLIHPNNKVASPTSSSASSSKSSSSNHSTTCTASGSTPRFSIPLPVERCLRQSTASFQRTPTSSAAGKVAHCANYHAHSAGGTPSRHYLVHNGNHWQ